MEAAKTQRGEPGQQKRLQHLEKLRLIVGEDPYELTPLSWNDQN